jgi:hypothetical protein
MLGLTLLQSLHTFPFPEEMKTAVQKLLVAVPDSLHTTLVQAEKVIGFEHFPGDIFHPESTTASQTDGGMSESHIVTTFLQGILDHSLVHLQYRSPYHPPLKTLPAKAREVLHVPSTLPAFLV